MLSCSRKLSSHASRSRWFSSFVFDGYKNSFVVFRNDNLHSCGVKFLPVAQCRSCSDVASTQSKKRSRPKREQTMITIPDKVHRSPTALLEALAETVGEDPTGHGWEYIDDPYLLPYTEKDRDDFKAAHHFGEAAADLVARNMPQLFTQDTAIPRIEQFYPHPLQIEAKGGIKVLNDSKWADSFDYEEDKIDRIAESYSLDEKIEYFTLTRKVEEAVTLFQSLTPDQRSCLSQGALSQLFCLLAYFGNVDRQPSPLAVTAVSNIPQAEKLNPTDDVIQTIDKLTNSAQDQVTEIPNMDENCLARQVFEMLEPKSASHYSAMIKALARFDRKSEAYFLFRQQLKAGMQFDTTVFNDVILCWGSSTGESESRETFGVSYPEFVKGILTEMRDNGVRPDANTFNSILKGIEDAESCGKLLLPTMREMEFAGVKPSLAVYANFLRLAISTKTRNYRNSCVSAESVPYEVIIGVLRRALRECAYLESTIIQSGSLHQPAAELPHVDAFGFAQTAMTVVLVCGRVDLFEAVHQFVETNSFLLKEEGDRSLYYKKYMQAIARLDDSSEWVSRFFAVVPTKFTPTVNMFIQDVLPEVSRRQRYDALPRLWGVLKLCNYAYRSQMVLNNFCALLNSESEVYEHNMTHSQRVQIADDVCNILDMVTETARKYKKAVTLNAEMLRCLLDVYIGCKQVSKAASLFSAGARMISNVRTTAFADIVEMFWEENLPTEAETFCVQCIDYLPPQSSKVTELVEIFRDQFSVGMPPKVQKQVADGYLSREDLELMQKTARASIDLVVSYSQKRQIVGK